MVVKYFYSLFDLDFVNNTYLEIEDARIILDDLYIRWQKKVMRARVMVGVLIVICCILIVILIIIYESIRKYDKCFVSIFGSIFSSDSIMKFIYFADVYYDLFYNKIILRSNFCRFQGVLSNDIVKYIVEYGRIGCDLLEFFFENILDVIKNVSDEQDVSFILLIGKCRKESKVGI